jgi:hypothetical protein
MGEIYVDERSNPTPLLSFSSISISHGMTLLLHLVYSDFEKPSKVDPVILVTLVILVIVH